MLTNIISICHETPLFPENYVSELKLRVSKVFPGSPDDFSSEVLCQLFGADDVSEIVDKEKLLRYPEFEPALSSSELKVLSNRLKNLLKKKGQSKVIDCVWATRNIINSVPKTLDDLVDYIPKKSLIDINSKFLIETSVIESKAIISKKFYDIEISKLSDQKISDCGDSIMDSVCSKSVESIDAITNRQKILGRAGEYYLLHRYGYERASLWLARFINPTTFCMCQDLECDRRHFGFVDVSATLEIVENNLGFLQAALDDGEAMLENGQLTDDKKQVMEMFTDLILYGLEALLLIDQDREEARRVTRLLSVLISFGELMSELSEIRMNKFLCAALSLYGDRVEDEFNLGDKERYEIALSSVRDTERYASQIGGDIRSEDTIVSGSHNFAMAGKRLIDTRFGVKLHNEFMKSLVDANSYDKFSQILTSILDGTNEEVQKPLDSETEKLFEFFLTEFSEHLIFRSRAIKSHWDVLARHSFSENVVQLLAEFGHKESMQELAKTSKKPRAIEFWENRAKLLEKLDIDEVFGFEAVTAREEI